MHLLRNLANLEKTLEKKRNRKKRIEEKVAKILKDVREKGDQALIEYTKKFDKVKLSVKELRVSETEISASFNELNSSIISSLKLAIDNVTKFYKFQIPKSTKIKEANGKVLKVSYIPLERVGIYVPAGQFPLVSTVYMTAIPAIVAGVKEIVLVSPPTKQKTINPFILAVASLLKIKEIYKVGGAQAIAALAYGTKTIKKVDKIIGPGNEFVTEAKRQVFGQVDIDVLAGPSEIVIIASRDANLDYIVADLEAQTEHRQGLGIVITNSKKIANQLRKKRLHGFVVRVRSLEEACSVANKIAPEHLEILTKKPYKLVKKIKNAGAVFLGENSPVALGDYLAGPSHVLPTQSTARFFSGLTLKDFLKEVHIVSYTKKALTEEFPVLEKIASLEGMVKHIESVKKRL
ncbi:MAG: histidinol dehydrogenase [Candidatus Omnitrophota bacterium]|nr:MAG: histidinol dehydrogenase [Candidatus Omnitrophota bacterium]